MTKEKKRLEQIIRRPITESRQHYIRLQLPATYRALLQAGVLHDWSMGYSTHTGFRAGTGHSFLWYDLEKETATPLRIHPFCFMDTTAHFDLKLTTEASFSRLRQMCYSVWAANSILTTIFHNFSLGADPEWKGWQKAYAAFIHETKAILTKPLS